MLRLSPATIKGPLERGSCHDHGTTPLPVMGPPPWLHGTGPIACYAAPVVERGRCCVAFREVSVAEIREVLRLWVRGYGLRAIARLAGVDRKTVRR